jgi:aarF domain-containing kinase
MLPPQLEEVLLRVQNSAHYMPAWQMERVMQAELGPEWRKQFSSFSDVPFASASIGQVHAAVLAEDHPSPLAGQRVAIKIQFPGVRSSIASDLGNLRWLLAASALLPKGLFLDNTIRVMQRELDDECDYVREADMIRRFGELTKDSQVFAVPRVVDELSTAQVLTTEMMRGRPLTQAARYTQDKRDQVSSSASQPASGVLTLLRCRSPSRFWSSRCASCSNTASCRRTRTGRTSCTTSAHARLSSSTLARHARTTSRSSTTGSACFVRLSAVVATSAWRGAKRLAT